MSDLSHAAWAPRGAFAGLLPEGGFGAPGPAGVTICVQNGVGLAGLIAPEGGEAALEQALQARFGLELPAAGRSTATGAHALLWTGPGQWLLRTEVRAGFAEAARSLADVAAVTEQSDGRAVLRLSGARLRQALAKGCMIDLHADAFPQGSVALTSIAHVGVLLRRAEDGPDGAVFEIMVPRSMAGSFWSWLSASAAEFGCRVVLADDRDTGRG